jgi:hypothetical protein
VRRAGSEAAPSGMGLEFSNLSSADRDALASYLEDVEL